MCTFFQGVPRVTYSLFAFSRRREFLEQTKQRQGHDTGPASPCTRSPCARSTLISTMADSSAYGLTMDKWRRKKERQRKREEERKKRHSDEDEDHFEQENYGSPPPAAAKNNIQDSSRMHTKKLKARDETPQSLSSLSTESPVHRSRATGGKRLLFQSSNGIIAHKERPTSLEFHKTTTTTTDTMLPTKRNSKSVFVRTRIKPLELDDSDVEPDFSVVRRSADGLQNFATVRKSNLARNRFEKNLDDSDVEPDFGSPPTNTKQMSNEKDSSNDEPGAMGTRLIKTLDDSDIEPDFERPSMRSRKKKNPLALERERQQQMQRQHFDSPLNTFQFPVLIACTRTRYFLICRHFCRCRW